MWLRITPASPRLRQPHVSGLWRENLAGSLHWFGKRITGNTRFLRLDRPARRDPSERGNGFCRRVLRVSSISREISWSVCLWTGKTLQDLLRALTECNHFIVFFIVFFFLFALILKHLYLCIIAFVPQAFIHSFIRKCTTLYHIFNYWNGVYFRRLIFCESIEKTYWALFFTWIIYFYRMSYDHVGYSWIQPDCADTDLTHGFDEAHCLYKSSHPSSCCYKYATCSFWICCMRCYLYSGVSFAAC